MPHTENSQHTRNTGSSGDDLGSTDEVKVFKDEGDREEEKISSENLLEEKSSLIDLTENEEKSSKCQSRSDHNSVYSKLDVHASSFNMGYLVSPYSYSNGGAGMPIANKIGLPSFFCHNGDPLTTPPPAHCGIPPYQLDAKAIGLNRPALYPFASSQYPYPMLSPDMAQVASWHTPSVYSATSTFRNPYPATLSMNTNISSDFSFRFTPNILPSVHTAHHHVITSHPGLNSTSLKADSIKNDANSNVATNRFSRNTTGTKSNIPCKEHNSDITNDKKRPHIKKPLNAFMLYMKEMRAKVVAECTLKESAAINQILGRRWHALGREEQAKYYELARRERQLHMQMYPDWSSRTNASRGKKRKRKQDVQDGGSNMKKCRARFGLDQQNQWCKPCRRKKKCIRYMEEISRNGFLNTNGQINRHNENANDSNADVDNDIDISQRCDFDDDLLGSEDSRDDNLIVKSHMKSTSNDQDLADDDEYNDFDNSESFNQSTGSPGSLSVFSSLQSPKSIALPVTTVDFLGPNSLNKLSVDRLNNSKNYHQHQEHVSTHLNIDSNIASCFNNNIGSHINSSLCSSSQPMMQQTNQSGKQNSEPNLARRSDVNINDANNDSFNSDHINGSTIVTKFNKNSLKTNRSFLVTNHKYDNDGDICYNGKIKYKNFALSNFSTVKPEIKSSEIKNLDDTGTRTDTTSISTDDFSTKALGSTQNQNRNNEIYSPINIEQKISDHHHNYNLTFVRNLLPLSGTSEAFSSDKSEITCVSNINSSRMQCPLVFQRSPIGANPRDINNPLNINQLTKRGDSQCSSISAVSLFSHNPMQATKTTLTSDQTYVNNFSCDSAKKRNCTTNASDNNNMNNVNIINKVTTSILLKDDKGKTDVAQEEHRVPNEKDNSNINKEHLINNVQRPQHHSEIHTAGSVTGAVSSHPTNVENGAIRVT